MEIRREQPPNIEKIRAKLAPDENTCFTYEDIIYAPNLTDAAQIEDHLALHEEIHSHQQRELGAVGWWDKYLEDPAFRLEEELLAYSAQYAFVCKKDIPAVVKKNFLGRIAQDLASPIYGNLLTQGQAESKIRTKAKLVV